MGTVRLTIAYDGSSFHGFATNPGVPTVQSALGEAISTVVRQPVALTGAGRTDAGVHAWGQVVSCSLPGDVDLASLARRLNKLLAPGIAVRAAAWAADGFDARHSATWRKYRYDVWNDPAPNPLLAGRAWFVPQPLALWAMQAACDPLIGEHDFTSFCRKPKVDDTAPEPSMIRRVQSATWRSLDSAAHLRFDVRANAFCHQMVRSIVGTLVDIGLGKATPGDVRGIMVAADRNAAGQVAPPHGLTLWEVGYGNEPN